MSREQVRALAEATVRIRRKRRRWTPFKGPQLDAFLADKFVDCIGYGGAGGGGKTDLELGLALLRHRRTVIYRRTFPQIAGAVERSKEIYTRCGKYNEGQHCWRIRTTWDIAGRLAKPVNRFIQFGSMQRLEDREKARGTPYDLRVFDEAQNFLKEQVLFTMAWTRTNVPGQHVTDLLCFNPPTTPEGLWLIDYFAPWIDTKHTDKAQPGEVRWFVTLPNGTEKEVPGPRNYKSPDFKRPDPILVKDEKGIERKLTPRSRTFFAARVTDNPVYMETGYMAVLDALPEPLRSQMRDGDFSAGLQDNAWQLFKTNWVRLAVHRGQEGHPKDDRGKLLPMSGLGVDIACGGPDDTALAPRYGTWFGPITVKKGTETPDGEKAADVIIDVLAGARVAPNIDVIGVGQGAKTALTMKGVKFNGINFAAKSYARTKAGGLEFVNVRAEAYWLFAEALDPESGVNIGLPDDRELFTELCTVRWKHTATGIQIEEKAEMKKRVSSGFHKLDAVILSWYVAQKASYGANPF